MHDFDRGPQEKNCLSKSSAEFFLFLIWNKLKRLADIIHHGFILISLCFNAGACVCSCLLELYAPRVWPISK